MTGGLTLRAAVELVLVPGQTQYHQSFKMLLASLIRPEVSQPKQSRGNPWLVLFIPPTSQSEETQKTNKEWNPNLLIQLKDNKIVLAPTRQIRGVRRRHPPPTLHSQSRFRMGNFYSLAWLRIGKIIELLNLTVIISEGKADLMALSL